MTAPLLLITGTGTGIGKTHLGEALLLAWGRRARVVGYKPVESGVDAGVGEDAQRLREASSFHVKPLVATFTFREPVSPHLAARREGREVDLEAVAARVRVLRARCDGVLVELPGGVFTPLTDASCNADLVLKLDPTAVVLVAPDRLGVLHDVGAVMVAARARGIAITAIALSAPERPDASTTTNFNELVRLWPRVAVLAVPRSSAAELSELPEIEKTLETCLLGASGAAARSSRSVPSG